jgi:UDP-N-acetylmuramate dehydrogenase
VIAGSNEGKEPLHAMTPELLEQRMARVVDPARVAVRAPLAPYTTFRIGGPADVLVEVTTAEELAAAVTAAREAGVPWFVLGLGANILVGDRGFRGVVIRNRAQAFTLGDDGRLVAESGAAVEALVLASVRAGWSGLEHYIGIPSTVGGALWQNLHFLSPAPARERTMFIAEVVESADVLLEAGGRAVLGVDAMGFGYDESVFHHHRHVVLSAAFRLERGDPAVLHRILQENLSWRGARHPWLAVHPSAGSIFKKIDGVGAGRLVDQCGLKGFRIGDAQLSHLHANIVVNLGAATAADVRALIAHAQEAVAARFGHHLEPEIGFIGEF